MRRQVIGTAAIAALLLTGCSNGDDQKADDTATQQVQDAKTTSLDKVEVNGEDGKKPKVEFEAPFAVAKAESKVYSEGDGDVIKDGDQVTAHMTTIDGSDPKNLQSTYDQGKPSGFPMDNDQVAKELVDALVGQKVGARVGLATPGENGPSVLYVIDIVETGKLKTRAEGKELPQKKDLPQVSRDDKGKPSISKPKGDPPKKLIVEPTIEGDGPKVSKDQEVTVQYSGWTWDDPSKTFDSSWDRGQPATFPLDGVIKGWTEGLAGQKVGSQVLLIAPPDMAYGEAGSPPNIGPNKTLVFVVDILDAN
ncbi:MULTISPECIES: FKBP-type peptidyl-prolyl cis-trans isomerase [unclassified Brevibacterium]|uniref:FKBP-type peptidyl-prolyl cis-trans isomerase n=1 Tax=unclassified Brevibacterium TaxID=2614124 RepID=UPI0008A6570D|nr:MULTISPECIES: FKBP-type peptidyl-prolyl cis-trans isomerase [unclassified Brevibacterium]